MAQDRHADYAPVKPEVMASVASTTASYPEVKSLKIEDATLSNTKIAVEDDFDAADFDDVDFSMADDTHPDEVVVDDAVVSTHFTNDWN